MRWEEFKNRSLEKLEYAKREGLADPRIYYLLDYINSKEGLVTTSSCSGRILLLAKGPSKKETYMYKKWHDPATPQEVREAIESYDGEFPLYYKVDPFILHIASRSTEEAFKVLKACKLAGLKRFGMQLMRRFYLIELQGTDKLEIPLEMCNCNLSRLVELSNEMMASTWQRTKLFYTSLEKVYR